MEHEPTIKQQTPTPEQLQRELSEIRCAYEQLRRESKALGARTSRMYIELERLRNPVRENGR